MWKAIIRITEEPVCFSHHRNEAEAGKCVYNQNEALLQLLLKLTFYGAFSYFLSQMFINKKVNVCKG